MIPDMIKTDAEKCQKDEKEIDEMMDNGVVLLSNLLKYDAPLIATFIVKEVSSLHPRRRLLDKLHARYIRILRNEQIQDITECLRKL
jgi:hypothetical protein